MEQAAVQTSWADVLLRGASALLDSQATRNYEVNDPKYNTAGGVAGQAQRTEAASFSATPGVWLAGAAVLALVLISLKR